MDVAREAEQNSLSLLDSFYRSIAKQPVVHQVNTQRDTTFEYPEGTVIAIAANTFVYDNGHPATGSVTFGITEWYDRASMICDRLSTTSHGQMLVTGGMLNLTAKDAAGRELKIKEGSTVDVQMPYRKRDEAMQLFVPVVNSNKATATGSGFQILANLDWLAGGQQQVQMPVPTVDVIDWTSGPTIYDDGMSRAVYLLDRNCELTNQEVKAELQKRYPWYEKIVVRRAWKHPFHLFGIMVTRALATFGEKENMLLSKAKKLKLVTPKEEKEALVQFQKTLKQYRDDSVRLAAMAQLQNKYGFKVKALGLINCDRFSTDPRPKVLYTIATPDTAGKHFVHRLFFHSIKSIMVPYGDAATSFSAIPAGEKVTLVSVGVKGNQTVASFKTFITDNTNPTIALQCQPTDPGTFKSTLQSILDTWEK